MAYSIKYRSCVWHCMCRMYAGVSALQQHEQYRSKVNYK